MGCVGINWASTFVKQHPELMTHFNQKYDYQGALCKDPEVIHCWFMLVQMTPMARGQRMNKTTTINTVAPGPVQSVPWPQYVV